MAGPAVLAGPALVHIFMFTPRWSNLGLLGVFTLAMLLGFGAGKLWAPGQRGTAAETNTEVDSAPQKAAVENSAVTHQSGLTKRASKILETVCRQLMAEAATADRDAQLLAAIEKLAERNPMLAIQIARSEINQRLRSQLLAAAFTGWGKTDATAAATWILSQPEGDPDHNAAIAAVLKGAVENPAAAVQLAQQLSAQNPDQAREYGDALIYALAGAGNFQAAADFATAATDGTRVELLAAAYGSWANYQSQNAATSALQIADPDARQSAMDAVISSWGQTDPKGLADFAAANLPDGDQKTRALGDALIGWAGTDALAAANWINQFSPSPEFDQGEAAIATQQEVMKQPDVALRWAESITDSNLRSRTIAAVVNTWSLSNPSSAMNYLQSTSDLTPEDRAGLLSQMSPH